MDLVWCISTTKISMLGEGAKFKRVEIGRSLYLFVLEMEVLSFLIHQAMEGGFILGYCLRERRR